MKKILIIEDDLDLLENTADYLREEGFKVITAEDGTKGVQQALLDFPDLILCDISMPGLDGYEVFKTLQDISTTSTIPFVFLTAKTEKEDIRMGMQLGADDYITKPFDYDELLTAINTRIDKQEKLLKAGDEKFYTLIDNSFFGACIIKDSIINYTNTKLAKILNYDKDLITGKDFLNFVSEEDKIQVSEKMRKCNKEIHASMQIEAYMENSDGRKIRAELMGRLINIKGKKNLIMNVRELLREKPAINKETKEIKDKVNLSSREEEVLYYICKGLSNNEIAKELFISNRTVDKHRASLISKTNSKNTAELVAFAIKHRLIEL